MTPENAKTESTKARCPVCKSPIVAAYAPFCSKRCADVDLHRWLSGGYAIPAVEAEESADDREKK